MEQFEWIDASVTAPVEGVRYLCAFKQCSGSWRYEYLQAFRPNYGENHPNPDLEFIDRSTGHSYKPRYYACVPPPPE